MNQQESKKTSLGANLSVKNEEHRILRMHLKNLRQFCDEIVITVDKDSTDNTYNICREYTEKVFLIDFSTIGTNIRSEGSARLSTDWELWVDADFVFPPKLQHEILHSIGNTGPSCYYLPIVNFIFGKWFLKKKYWNYQIRLFDKQRVTYKRDDLHNWEFVYPDNPGYLKFPILHFAFSSISEFVNSANRYTDLDKENLKKGRPGGLYHRSFDTIDNQVLLKDPLNEFDKLYNHLGYNEEKEFGTIYSWLFAFYSFLERAKMFEYEYKEKNNRIYDDLDMQEIEDLIVKEMDIAENAKKYRSYHRYRMKKILRGITPPYLISLFKLLFPRYKS